MEELLLAGGLQLGNNLLMNQANVSLARENRDYYSEGERYKRLLELGVNPNIAMESILGNPSAAQNAPTVSSEGLDTMMQGLIEQPQMRSSINYEQSLTDYYKSMKSLTDTQNMWFPLEADARVKVANAEMMSLHSYSFMNDALAGKYKEESKTIVPLAGSELVEAYSRTQNWIASAAAYLEQSEVFKAQVGYFKNASVNEAAQAREHLASAYVAEVEGLVSGSTMQEQIDIIVALRDLKQALASEEGWNAMIKDLSFGLGVSGDTMSDMAIFQALGGDYASFANEYMEKVKKMSSTMYDHQVSNQMRNFWNSVILDFANVPSEFAGGFGSGLAFGLGSGKFAGESRVPKATGATLKSTPVSSSGKYKPSTKPMFGTKWTDADRAEYFRRVNSGIK